MQNTIPKYDNEDEILKSFNNSNKISDFLKYNTKTKGTYRYYKLRLKEFVLERQVHNIDEYLQDPRTMSNKKRIQYLLL